MHFPIAVLLLALAASRISAQGGTLGAWLILCASDNNAVPFGLTAGKQLNNICATLNAGRDPDLADVTSAVPAALPCTSYSSGVSVEVTPASISTGQGRGAKATIDTFVAALASGATLPPELIAALATGIVYPQVYILSGRFSPALPRSSALTSVWMLRNVLLSDIDVTWSADSGDQHTLKFVTSAASYRVYTQATNGAVSRYPNVGCYNANRNLASVSASVC